MRVEATPASLVQYAGQGDATTVSLLVEAGVSARSVDAVRATTPLHAAAAQGHMRVAERLIVLGADVNARDWHGATPLVNAAAAGSLPLVRALLRSGARVDVVPSAAPTALIAAVQRGDAQLVEELLAAGASPHLPDAFGTTPADAARRARRSALQARLESAR
jgi:ankyrin repeat protein